MKGEMHTTIPIWVNLYPDTSSSGIEPVWHDRGYIRKIKHDEIKHDDKEKKDGGCKSNTPKYKKHIQEK